jgi:hypothetical protein
VSDADTHLGPSDSLLTAEDYVAKAREALALARNVDLATVDGKRAQARFVGNAESHLRHANEALKRWKP